MSTPQSVIMYQTVHDYDSGEQTRKSPFSRLGLLRAFAGDGPASRVAAVGVARRRHLRGGGGVLCVALAHSGRASVGVSLAVARPPPVGARSVSAVASPRLGGRSRSVSGTSPVSLVGGSRSPRRRRLRRTARARRDRIRSSATRGRSPLARSSLTRPARVHTAGGTRQSRPTGAALLVAIARYLSLPDRLVIAVALVTALFCPSSPPRSITHLDRVARGPRAQRAALYLPYQADRRLQSTALARSSPHW